MPLEDSPVPWLPTDNGEPQSRRAGSGITEMTMLCEMSSSNEQANKSDSSNTSSTHQPAQSDRLERPKDFLAECMDGALKKASTVPHTTWWQTSLLMLGEVMGSGILGLPAAAARLGWALSLITLGLFAVFSSYAGILLARTKNNFFPDADGYADLAHATVGKGFGLFTRIAIVSNWVALLPYYLIATGSAIQNMADGSLSSCGVVWSVRAVLSTSGNAAAAVPVPRDTSSPAGAVGCLRRRLLQYVYSSHRSSPR